MREVFVKALIDHCAPTLAGHKCGSLFTLRWLSRAECEDCVQEANRMLCPKGVRIALLKNCETCCLVYVYRPAQLKAKLSEPAIQAFLRSSGYKYAPPDEILRQLSQRIQNCAVFPHEIGIILDYPLEDVKGFIENRGENYKCLGCWKAYCDEREAQKRFALYRKCKAVYQDCYRRGFDVMRLTVAA